MTYFASKPANLTCFILVIQYDFVSAATLCLSCGKLNQIFELYLFVQEFRFVFKEGCQQCSECKKQADPFPEFRLHILPEGEIP
mmetsp:Transcript_18191/g.25517  ORF Transcript_18191/g.25517 Transcript_18191/m.25517 type:complete len:84 (+) Transcript_18191:118-369(+)